MTSFSDPFNYLNTETEKMVPVILQEATVIVEAFNNLNASSVSSLCLLLKESQGSSTSRLCVIQKFCELKGKVSEEVSIKIRDGFVSVLVDKNPEIRKAAAKALAELGEDRWQECIKGEDEDVVCLAQVGDMRILEALVHRLEEESFSNRELEEALLSFGPVVICPLLELLKRQMRDNYSRGSMNSACHVLSHFRDPQMFDTLSAIIKSFPDSRGSAAEALAGQRDPRCIPLLKESIAIHGLAYSRKIRGSGIDNMMLPLVELGQKSTGVLIELLAHDNAEIREQAAVALEKIVDPRALGSLIPILSDTARFLSLGLLLLQEWPFGVESNFVAEAAAKAIEKLLRTCPENLGENNLQLLACLPHKQKIKERLIDDTFENICYSFQKVTYRVEDRYGVDCREIRLLATLELSRRRKIRIVKALA
jgi:HEAT repeat protein